MYDLHQAVLGTSAFCVLNFIRVGDFCKTGMYLNSKLVDMFAGILFSVLITAVLTDAIKDAVGRPRPDFFWRCFPDGIGVGILISLFELIVFVIHLVPVLVNIA